jgi:hypothetical protein
MTSDPYLTMKDAAAACGLSLRTMYSLAGDLGVIEVRYGRNLIPRAKLPEIKAAKRPRGNPRWIEDPAAASAAAKKGARKRWRAAKKKGK